MKIVEMVLVCFRVRVEIRYNTRLEDCVCTLLRVNVGSKWIERVVMVTVCGCDTDEVELIICDVCNCCLACGAEIDTHEISIYNDAGQHIEWVSSMCSHCKKEGHANNRTTMYW